ncbi:MAG: MoxR family ATPase [Spirulina sp. SIO3F2]|nr:MoxR family ATPase [Spirulina sp. SIO3F2]
MSTPQTLLQQIQTTLDKIVVGQQAVVEQLLVALLSGGHVILEGVPGTGKTLLVKVISRLLQSDFRRIQLTPDVLPADIVGTHIFDLNSRTFTLQRGPVFTDILLADEINRTPPKTQSALLEAMEEQQVTLEGETLSLSDGFWVVATQNPLEFEGTYPLPEAQLDRFLFKIVVDYPAPDAEKQMLLNVQRGFRAKRLDLLKVDAIADIPQILQARKAVRQVQVSEPVLDYVLALVARSRQHNDIVLGASPRAAVAWLQTAQAHAWLNEQEFVTPDDIKAIALPLLRHRLRLSPEAQLDGVQVETVINALLSQVPVPR